MIFLKLFLFPINYRFWLSIRIKIKTDNISGYKSSFGFTPLNYYNSALYKICYKVTISVCRMETGVLECSVRACVLNITLT